MPLKKCLGVIECLQVKYNIIPINLLEMAIPVLKIVLGGLVSEIIAPLQDNRDLFNSFFSKMKQGDSQ